MASVDFDAHYRVDGYDGVAWYLVKFYAETGVDEWGDTYHVEDRDRVVAVMVGDDRKFEFGVDEIHKIPEDGFCRDCGQIGCGCNVHQ